MSKRKSTSNNGEQLSRKPQSLSKSSNSAGKKRSLPINISIESDDENEMDDADADADALPATSTEITNQSSSAPLKEISSTFQRQAQLARGPLLLARIFLAFRE
ncbi:hypothetical protein DAPPUDRAFT_96619 [Daphnia pulex]|uniref:Uncharacterized protein n=1 Tax=Daphnia pulex TaxID=6669 RepID=E9FYE7_DAPPU|nr:hypothetical protein DAPPUDRAFT_96619 [Daphnia pulex]|eukprot:EFX87518.1 hypothetical protein DAPPUDRAFT_96619 [Daphnia pulex]